MESVAITGVSSGIGRGITKVLIENGFHVFGSVRNATDATRLRPRSASTSPRWYSMSPMPNHSKIHRVYAERRTEGLGPGADRRDCCRSPGGARSGLRYDAIPDKLKNWTSPTCCPAAGSIA